MPDEVLLTPDHQNSVRPEAKVKAPVDLPAEMPKEFAPEVDGERFDVKISPKRAKTD